MQATIMCIVFARGGNQSKETKASTPPGREHRISNHHEACCLPGPGNELANPSRQYGQKYNLVEQILRCEWDIIKPPTQPHRHLVILVLAEDELQVTYRRLFRPCPGIGRISGGTSPVAARKASTYSKHGGEFQRALLALLLLNSTKSPDKSLVVPSCPPAREFICRSAGYLLGVACQRLWMVAVA
jgi:hypothetical protein